MAESNKAKEFAIIAGVILTAILVWLLLRPDLDGIGVWIELAAVLLFICAPFVLRWHLRRTAKSSTNVPNEAPAKWRKLEIDTDVAPLWGWFGAPSGRFRSAQDAIYCDGLAIPITEIVTAVIFTPADFPLGTGFTSVLRITTSSAVYDFSISRARLDTIDLPFQVTTARSEFIPKLYRRLLLLALVVIFLLIVIVEMVLKEN